MINTGDTFWYKKQSRIIVVEDDELTARIIGKMLEALVYDVTLISNTVGACDKILDYNPEKIICNLVMPKVDGLNLLMCIRETKDLKTVKFIILSTGACDFNQNNAYALGANGGRLLSHHFVGIFRQAPFRQP